MAHWLDKILDTDLFGCTGPDGQTYNITGKQFKAMVQPPQLPFEESEEEEEVVDDPVEEPVEEEEEEQSSPPEEEEENQYP